MLMKDIKHVQECNGTGGNINSSDNGNGNLKTDSAERKASAERNARISKIKRLVNPQLR